MATSTSARRGGSGSTVRGTLGEQGEEFSTAAGEAAVAFAEASGWGPEELPLVVRLAEAFDAFDARQRARAGRSVALPSTPAGRVERQAALGRYGRLVAGFRSRVFGAPEPPFARPADALGWLRGLFERQEEAVDADSLEIGGERKSSGVPGVVWQQQSLEAEALPVRWGAIPVTRIWARPGAYPLWPFALLCHRIAGVLQVEPGEVVRYVLMGTLPEFPVARAGGVVASDDVGDGGEAIVAPRVEVSVFTPELTRSELRELQRAVRAAWPTVDEATDAGLDALERGARRPTVTSTDAELSELVHDLGGEPRRGQRTAFWDHVAEAWAAQGNRPVAGDSLRRRWRRLEAKRPPEVPVPEVRGRRARA